MCSLVPYSLFPFLRSSDHDFSGFDEGDGLFAGLQFQFANGVGGNDGGNALIADGEHHLGQQAVDLDLDKGTNKLVASADARRPQVGGAGGQELLKSADGDAVVAARRLDRSGCGRPGSSA